MNTSIGLRDPLLLAPEERVVRNNWVTDVYGRSLGFGDMGVLELATIESHAEPYGALLLIEESGGGVMRLGDAASEHREATDEQLEAIEKLAALYASGNYTPSLLNGRALVEAVPALYLARIAVVKGDILFNVNGASRAQLRFEELLQPDKQTHRLAKPENRELYDHAWALSTTSLTPAEFIIEAAKRVQKAQR